jgi:hypothetical protein
MTTPEYGAARTRPERTAALRRMLVEAAARQPSHCIRVMLELLEEDGVALATEAEPSVPNEYAWIRHGARILYWPSAIPETMYYAGTVEGVPRLLGKSSWCVRLVDMDPRYRDGKRSTVAAASCGHLAPVGGLSPFVVRTP